MSERSVIVAVLLAAAMFGLWRLTEVLTPDSGVQRTPMLDFDPARVRSIQVRSSTDARPEATLAREDFLGQPRWIISWDRQDRTIRWPADESRVRAALRISSTAELETRKPTGSIDGVELQLQMVDGTTRTVRFAQAPIAGRVEVLTEPDGHTGLVDAAIFDAFVRTGLLAWLETRPMLALGAGPAGLELQSPSGSLALLRRQGRWVIVEPLQDRADAQASEALQRKIESITLERILSAADPSDPKYGFDKPLATVQTDTAVRIARDGQTTSVGLQQQLIVGNAVDATGEEVYVRVRWIQPDAEAANEARANEIAGTLVATVRTETLNDLTTQPDAYLSRKAIDQLAATIDRVTLNAGASPLVLVRDGPNWTADREPLLPGETDSIDDLIRVLTEQDADGVRIVEPSSMPDTNAITATLGLRTGQTRVQIYAVDQGILIVVDSVARSYGNKPDLVPDLTALMTRLGHKVDQPNDAP